MGEKENQIKWKINLLGTSYKKQTWSGWNQYHVKNRIKVLKRRKIKYNIKIRNFINQHGSINQANYMKEREKLDLQTLTGW